MSLAWALSFAACYRVSRELSSDDAFLDTWWALRLSAVSAPLARQLEQIFWQSINLFNSPSGILTPLGVLPSAFIGLGLFLLGAWSLGRRWKGGLDSPGFAHRSWHSRLRCCIDTRSTAGSCSS